jgi:hypothetical protein
LELENEFWHGSKIELRKRSPRQPKTQSSENRNAAIYRIFELTPYRVYQIDVWALVSITGSPQSKELSVKLIA